MSCGNCNEDKKFEKSCWMHFNLYLYFSSSFLIYRTKYCFICYDYMLCAI